MGDFWHRCFVVSVYYITNTPTQHPRQELQMNTTAPRLPTRESNPAPRRSSRRERGYGTGYGRSSGYADNERRYTNQDANERFRVH